MIYGNCKGLYLISAFNKIFYQKEYQSYRKANYIYIIDDIKLLSHNQKSNIYSFPHKFNVKDINDLFYEGLGSENYDNR